MARNPRHHIKHLPIPEARDTAGIVGGGGRLNHRTRILIADDHKLVAEACKRLLEPEFEVVGIVADGRSLVQAAEELRPEVIILDVTMPQLNGLDAGEQVRVKNRKVKLIYLTMNPRADVAAEAFRRGASGYVLKQCSSMELINAIHRVLHNEAYLSPLITKETVDFLLLSCGSLKEKKNLSFRQREVLQLLAEGKSMKEVAYHLCVQPGTVAFHKYKIMETLGLESTAELIEYALKEHMLA